MVEGTRLEIERRGNSSVGSNPTLSALCRKQKTANALLLHYTLTRNLPALRSGWLRSDFTAIAGANGLQRPGVALVAL